MLTDWIIYQDTHLLVINKPAGLIVNSATSHSQVSLQQQLAAYLGLPDPPPDLIPDQYSSPEQTFLFRQGMVHRLDKDTSGLLLWAKDPDTLSSLLAQFQKRQVAKTYLALCHGILHPDTGRICLPLGRKSGKRQLISVRPDGKPALTYYQVQQLFYHFDATRLLSLLPATPRRYHTRDLQQLYQGFSLLALQPRTGRTHQLRAHLTHLGHPLVADTAYLPARKAKLDPYWCPRQFLHASRLEFTHPSTQQRLTFTSALPSDLQAVLTYLS